MADDRSISRRSTIALLVAAYLVLLAASSVWRLAAPGAQGLGRTVRDETNAILPLRHPDGHLIPGREIRVYTALWLPDRIDDPDRLPVVLVHGSPGSKENFDAMGPMIMAQGRRVLAPDLPGSGRTPMAPDMSLAGQARVVLSTMDWAIIARAHVVGWSSGGGVAIRMAQQRPERVASITMLASIGAQHTEGSGSYVFEHAKYAAGIVVLGVLPELIPHFGYLGDYTDRAGWLVAFWDSDQRDMARVMRDLGTPTLIVHGRHDPLVPDWAAQEHKRIMDDSARLIMLDAMHFMPFTMPERTTELLSAHFDRHDDPDAPPRTDVVDEAPVPEREGAAALIVLIGRALVEIPWWIEVLILVPLTRWRPWSASVAAGLFVATMRLDPGVALLGLAVGRVWGVRAARDPLERPWSIMGYVTAALWMVVALALATAWGAAAVWPATERRGAIGLVAAFAIGASALALVSIVAACAHRRGRWRANAIIARLTRHEYWPTWALYLPVLIRVPLWLARLKGAIAMTALNPGYGDDAGVFAERKSEIATRFTDRSIVLDLALVERDADADASTDKSSDERPDERTVEDADRFTRARELVESRPELGGYPIIAKPDTGQNGRGVALLRDERDLRRYINAHPEPFVLQRYHPGPLEIGVVWTRDPRTITDPNHHHDPVKGRLAGRVKGITIKQLPEIEGDGRTSLRMLILRDPRLRVQAGVFFRANRASLDEVPGAGETVRLGVAGNHLQGAMLEDGSRLITPELERAIDRIAGGFADEHGRGFDIGRFDLRCPSREALARGEDLGVIELNGLTAEPTQIYDPSRSIWWAWGQILGYWRDAVRLAQARIASGTGEPMDRRAFTGRLLAHVQSLL